MAIQRPNGVYNPVEQPFSRQALQSHLAGNSSLGHYMLSKEGTTKLFAFDLDFEEGGCVPTEFSEGNEVDGISLPTKWITSVRKKSEEEPAINPEWSPRAVWRSRSYVGRWWMKAQIMGIAARIASFAATEMELRVALAYSGHKGVHVYCFLPEPMNASDAREGAVMLIEDFMGGTAVRGKSFYHLPDTDEYDHNENVSIEVFPKQTKIQEGGYGNLMRLPLGKNLKAPKDPTFFIDLANAPISAMAPVPADKVSSYLQNGNPWL